MLKRDRERRRELLMIHQWYWDPLRGRFSLERGVSHPSGEILEYNIVCISRHIY